ncbi:Hypothetical predicted protein [Paramuricea clavata]|uniref:Uncharacterized protein n=1 Tax=Paramuricea clavata TaxID=317549 RepID=A0A7D9IP87_PARCT|nr:Hypothetical predicted protein [Paramuricea clavata]
MDIERHLNNRPLTYIESDGGEPQESRPDAQYHFMGRRFTYFRRPRTRRKQLVCPLEIRSSEVEEPKAPTPEVEEKRERPPRRAAEKAKERMRHWLADED